MYDIFYVSKNSIDDIEYQNLKVKFPTLQKVANFTSMDQIKKMSFTKMFWIIWDDVILEDTFDLKSYRATKWDDQYIHVFRNGDYKDGICLVPKNIEVSTKELVHRYFISKKEIEINASRPKKFKVFYPKSYENYLDLVEKQSEDMFWIIWPEVEMIDESILDLYFDHSDVYNRNENHTFLNLCNDDSSYYNGIVLCSKNKKFSKREFEKRYLIDKKEYNVIASRFRYPRYPINNFEEFQLIKNKETQSMFWAVWPDIEITDDSIFDLYYDPRDGKYDFEREIVHIFKNREYNDGLCLFPTNIEISEKEFKHRFFTQKKQEPKVVSKPKPYDIIFISYNEINADENFKKIKKKFPRIKRVHGVKGIHQAHIKAAELAETDMFWVVDGDAVLVDEFNFDYQVARWDHNVVHVWRSQNPINDLVYGYGGIKLLPRDMTINMDLSKPDMTTSISSRFKAVKEVSNITKFNVDPFSTWRSAFRECCKLSSKIIDRQKEEETVNRLEIWCTLGIDREYGEYAIAGAKAGRAYGEENKGKPEALRKINDFDWLKMQFSEMYE
jgi:hypothetical protein